MCIYKAFHLASGEVEWMNFSEILCQGILSVRSNGELGGTPRWLKYLYNSTIPKIMADATIDAITPLINPIIRSLLILLEVGTPATRRNVSISLLITA